MQFKIVSAQLFHSAITEAKTFNLKYACTLETYSVEQYESCTCFLAFIGAYPLGYAIRNIKYGVRPYSELISVFKHSYINGRYGSDIIQHAVNNGANVLNCFEPIRYMYEMFGFITVEKNSFDASLAGPEWNYSLLGTPAVHLMHKPKTNN